MHESGKHYKRHTVKEPESTSPEELIEQIHALRRAACTFAKPAVTGKEAQQMYVRDRFREVSVDLLQRGVTVAILEGAFLVWWLRVACAQRFEKSGFEYCLAHIGPLCDRFRRCSSGFSTRSRTMGQCLR